jgi:hypothetical protein
MYTEWYLQRIWLYVPQLGIHYTKLAAALDLYKPHHDWGIYFAKRKTGRRIPQTQRFWGYRSSFG